MNALVILSSALLCVSGRCYPALVGSDTPTGTFAVHRRVVDSPGYGGDVLEFDETGEYVFAIHRVWTLRPQEHRVERLESGDVRLRRGVTKGCINVMPEVYDQLNNVDEVQIVP
jgi:hypothetical protein